MTRGISMRIQDLDTERRILVIAEIGNNHEGNFALAQKMIDRAAEAGADAVKFQTFRTEEYVSRKDAARFQRLKSFELSYDQFARLAEQAKQAGLLFLSTPFDLTSADFLGTVADAIKIASGDNTFFPLLGAAARTGKPLVLSAGIADLHEIAISKAHIERCWAGLGIQTELAVLHCVTSYPVEPAQANLAAIHSLMELGCTIGYSDHTLGIEAAVLAAGMGARIIEKHFTLDKAQSDFRDHQLAADPPEFARMVERIRNAEVLRGSGEKIAQPSERTLAPAVRRSIVAKHDLTAGQILTFADITWVRPGGGLAPGRETEIIGKRLVRDVSAGEPLALDMIQR